MSYCRMGDDSDVYAFRSPHGYECCGCLLNDDGASQRFPTAEDLLSHMHAHLDFFHRVPEYALQRLREDASNSVPNGVD